MHGWYVCDDGCVYLCDIPAQLGQWRLTDHAFPVPPSHMQPPAATHITIHSQQS